MANGKFDQIKNEICAECVRLGGWPISVIDILRMYRRQVLIDSLYFVRYKCVRERAAPRQAILFTYYISQFTTSHRMEINSIRREKATRKKLEKIKFKDELRTSHCVPQTHRCVYAVRPQTTIHAHTHTHASTLYT